MPSNAKTPSDEPIGTFCNQPWSAFFERTGISPAELWEPGVPRTASNAHLYPVLCVEGQATVEDVLWMQPGAHVPPRKMEAYVHRWRSAWRLPLHTIVRKTALAAELNWRQELGFVISEYHTRLALAFPSTTTSSSLQPADGQPSQCILPFLNASAANKRLSTFELLDDIAVSYDSPAVSARTLACIADLLNAWAGGKGGLRSGPGRNASFAAAMEVSGDKRLRGIDRYRHRWI